MNLAEIKARTEAATPGPWIRDGFVDHDTVRDLPVINLDVYPGTNQAKPVASDIHNEADAEFIAHAREDIPKLVAALEAVLEPHNSDGTRWVGFPRATHQEMYCTGCSHPAPCPTVHAATDALA